ncbi:phosphohistidine phosphatase SixA [Thiorhodococcus mannitoliphagus]|uniref:Phosphohistidine phosphatase SixA n=1 Tax=Thiorhodococcus mannitoliphagus TaxID=329406 RepID=A0A6P1DSW6_9GAMM|nr:phosphohistidine phosphatase SixA [Thiorhodococcus mannitoliphagus]NEX20293.1 phosphohistidine phosphatase SixA [Thiorhodococcus mannitoliphagus]
MHLYLAQHGLAVPEDVDPERPLSPQGRTDIERLAARLGRARIVVEPVLHRSKTRAAQTAKILAGPLRASAAPQARGGLKPNDPVEALASEIADWSADTLIVGHLPFVGRLAAHLLVADANQALLAFQPGSLACLERDADGHWRLAGMLRPELLTEVSR